MKWVALVALSLASSGAGAQDFGLFRPTNYSWTGAYLGLRAGYVTSDATTLNLATANGLTHSSVGSFGLRGGQFGGLAGYNFHLVGTPLVFGIEGDINVGRIERSVNSTVNLFGANVSAKTTSSWNGSVRGRLGLAVDHALIYGTAGAAYLDMRSKGEINLTAATWNRSESTAGWTLGGGVDYAFSNALFAGVEYRYTGLGKQSITSLNGLYTASSTQGLHSVSLRLGQKF